jgi:hypothetical protein
MLTILRVTAVSNRVKPGLVISIAHQITNSVKLANFTVPGRTVNQLGVSLGNFILSSMR